MTPKEQEAIELFAAGRKIELADWQPDESAISGRCWETATRHAKQKGGKVEFCYYFNSLEVGKAISCVGHALWRRSDGRLVDVSPRDYDPAHDTKHDGKVVVVIDREVKPMRFVKPYMYRDHLGSPITIFEPLAGHWVIPCGPVLPLSRASRKIAAQISSHRYNEARAIAKCSVPAIAT